jgi:hypothetical protein
MASPSATFPLLHRFLGIGLLAMAAVLAVLRSLGMAPPLGAGAVTLAIAATISGIAVVLAVVALFVLRPQVPDRAPGQMVEQYWSAPGVGTKVVSVWFLMEGAGMLAVVGYFLTGEPIAAIAAGLTIVAFWRCGPNVFAKA